ncbi:hypothetical protein [Pseudomonas putida]|uniref:hypothetical protein n=1 Tax=Pseudomonas putida TaxID=303 RepID=UPI0037F70F94
MPRKSSSRAEVKVPLEVVELLGKVSDRELAKRTGLSPYYIKQARLSQGIEAYSHAHDLSEEVISLLGQVPDKQIKERFGVSHTALCRIRQARSIPRASKRFLSTDTMALLGQISDHSLAKKAGTTLYSIQQARRAAGIEAARYKRTGAMTPKIGSSADLPGRLSAWTEELLSLLGKIPDRELSERSHGRLSVSAVANMRGRKRIKRCGHEAGNVRRIEKANAVELLGKLSDGEVADRIGVDRSTVMRERKRRGIEAASLPHAKWSTYLISLLGTLPDAEIVNRSNGVLDLAAVRAKRYSLNIVLPPELKMNRNSKELTDEAVSLLGKVSDAELARKIGVSRTNVQSHRKRLGIAPKARASSFDPSKVSSGPEMASTVPPVIRVTSKWTRELLALLGKIPDQDLVERSLGALSIKGIRKKRYALGIRVCPAIKKKTRIGKAAAADVVVMLGTLSDYELSKRTGVERTAITRQRLALGIAPAMRKGRPGRNWTEEEDALFEQLSAEKIARRLGISAQSARKRRAELRG